MSDVEDDQRFVDIHFEITTGAAKAHRHIVSHDLYSDHGQRLSLCRIHFAGHDRRARLVGWNNELSETGSRPARHQSNVIGNLVERHRQRPERTGKLYQVIVSTLHRELVRCADEGQARKLRNFGSSRFPESRSCIDAGPNCCAAEREAIHPFHCILNSIEIVGEHAVIARPLLSKCEWRSVLHMSAADLDRVFPLLSLGCDRIAQGLHRTYQSVFHIHCRRNVHRGGERVIRRLRHVYVIVGMDRRLASKRRPRELATPVGNDLVHVHVELGPASRHPDVQREHVFVLAGKDLVASVHDEPVTLVIEPLPGMVGIGGAFFQRRVCCDHLPWD